jgi:TATA box binding protein associated factor (TAF)
MSSKRDKKSSSVSVHGGGVTVESVKVIAESVGVPSLSDDVLHYIGDDVTFRLKFIVQVGIYEV